MFLNLMPLPFLLVPLPPCFLCVFLEPNLAFSAQEFPQRLGDRHEPPGPPPEEEDEAYREEGDEEVEDGRCERDRLGGL
ncbi:hypothetical protein DACRYDRAFT_22210 [Dacryopinax primogenitus]|uniref:Secreted protein n=1 Tax=Dacryopinax primogenitus (strain DJM 731) TaxID=1858805 RepID=M5GCL3_DACPD|nr:uncharacterized protein DACRYDRAFT_22210 [Dacryopinax primogenitus]EJU01838.1 hypothetical protein DACRYDRAFT_22210 [Dacryopinax primogenitus]